MPSIPGLVRKSRKSKSTSAIAKAPAGPLLEEAVEPEAADIAPSIPHEFKMDLIHMLNSIAATTMTSFEEHPKCDGLPLDLSQLNEALQKTITAYAESRRPRFLPSTSLPAFLNPSFALRLAIGTPYLGSTVRKAAPAPPVGCSTEDALRSLCVDFPCTFVACKLCGVVSFFPAAHALHCPNAHLASFDSESRPTSPTAAGPTAAGSAQAAALTWLDVLPPLLEPASGNDAEGGSGPTLPYLVADTPLAALLPRASVAAAGSLGQALAFFGSRFLADIPKLPPWTSGCSWALSIAGTDLPDGRITSIEHPLCTTNSVAAVKFTAELLGAVPALRELASVAAGLPSRELLQLVLRNVVKTAAEMKRVPVAFFDEQWMSGVDDLVVLQVLPLPAKSAARVLRTDREEGSSSAGSAEIIWPTGTVLRIMPPTAAAVSAFATFAAMPYFGNELATSKRRDGHRSRLMIAQEIDITTTSGILAAFSPDELRAAPRLVAILRSTEGVVPQLVDDDGNSVLHVAVLCGCSPTLLQLLLTAGYSPCVYNRVRHRFALHDAAEMGNLSAVRLLASASQNISVDCLNPGVHDDGFCDISPLFLACSGNHVDVFITLQEQGADIYRAISHAVAHKYASNWLLAACRYGFSQIVGLLVESNTSILKMPDWIRGLGLLLPTQAAALSGSVPTYTMLAGAPMHLIDSESVPATSIAGSTTALHIAAACGHTGLLVYMLEHGADASQLDALGTSALHIATARGSTRSVAILLEYHKAALSLQTVNVGKFYSEIQHHGCHADMAAGVRAGTLTLPSTSGLCHSGCCRNVNDDANHDYFASSPGGGMIDSRWAYSASSPTSLTPTGDMSRLVLECVVPPHIACRVPFHFGKYFLDGGALHVAARGPDAAVLGILLEADSQALQNSNTHGVFPLDMAAAFGMLANVQKILAVMIESDGEMQIPTTSFIYAVAFGHTDVALCLLKAGVHIEEAVVMLFADPGSTKFFSQERVQQLQSMFLVALLSQPSFLVILNTVLSCRIDGNSEAIPVTSASQRSEGNAPATWVSVDTRVHYKGLPTIPLLCVAADSSNSAAVACLLRRGADPTAAFCTAHVETECAGHGSTALYFAASRGDQDSVRSLIAALHRRSQFPCELQDFNGRSALCPAAKWRYASVLRQLISTGVQVAQDKTGMSPLHYVSMSWYDAPLVIKELPPPMMATIPHYASLLGNSFPLPDLSVFPARTVPDLISSTSELCRVRTRGHELTVVCTNASHAVLPARSSALHAAAFVGNIPAVRALLLCGADITAVNNKNETPLDVARLCGHSAVVRLLELAGFLQPSSQK